MGIFKVLVVRVLNNRATVHLSHPSIECMVATPAVASGNPLTITASPKFSHQPKCVAVVKFTAVVGLLKVLVARFLNNRATVAWNVVSRVGHCCQVGAFFFNFSVERDDY